MPRLAVTLGDPRGIGPEITRRALESSLNADVTLVGPDDLIEAIPAARRIGVGPWGAGSGEDADHARARKAGLLAGRAIEAATRVMGKTPVEVHDSPGFVSNRVLLPMINEAIFCLHEGVGTAAAIDEVMKLGMNHPMGPLALADLIGLDVCLDILRVLEEGFGDPKYRPCPLLVKMVDAGYLGRKSGRGFHTYA